MIIQYHESQGDDSQILRVRFLVIDVRALEQQTILPAFNSVKYHRLFGTLNAFDVPAVARHC